VRGARLCLRNQRSRTSTVVVTCSWVRQRPPPVATPHGVPRFVRAPQRTAGSWTWQKPDGRAVIGQGLPTFVLARHCASPPVAVEDVRPRRACVLWVCGSATDARAGAVRAGMGGVSAIRLLVVGGDSPPDSSCGTPP